MSFPPSAFQSPTFSAASFINSFITSLPPKTPPSSLNSHLASLTMTLASQTTEISDELTQSLTAATTSQLPKLRADTERLHSSLEFLKAEAATLDDPHLESSNLEPSNLDSPSALSTLATLHALKTNLTATHNYLTLYAQWSQLHTAVTASLASPDLPLSSLTTSITSLSSALNDLNDLPNHASRQSQYNTLTTSLTTSLLPRLTHLATPGRCTGLPPLATLYTIMGKPAFDILINEYVKQRVNILAKSWFDYNATTDHFPTWLREYFDGIANFMAEDHTDLTAVFDTVTQPLVRKQLYDKLGEKICTSFQQRVNALTFDQVAEAYMVTHARKVHTVVTSDTGSVTGVQESFDEWLTAFDENVAAATKTIISNMADACTAIISDYGVLNDASITTSPILPVIDHHKQRIDALVDQTTAIRDHAFKNTTSNHTATIRAAFDAGVDKAVAQFTASVLQLVDYGDVDESLEWFCYRVNVEHFTKLRSKVAARGLVDCVTGRVTATLANIVTDEEYKKAKSEENYSKVPNSNVSRVGEFLINSVRVMEEIGRDMKVGNVVTDEWVSEVKEVGLESYSMLCDVLGGRLETREIREIRYGRILSFVHPTAVTKSASYDEEGEDEDEEGEDEGRRDEGRFTDAVVCSVCAAVVAHAIAAVVQIKGGTAEGAAQVHADWEYLVNVVEAVSGGGEGGLVLLRHGCVMMELDVADLARWIKRGKEGAGKGEELVRRMENGLARLRGVMVFEE